MCPYVKCAELAVGVTDAGEGLQNARRLIKPIVHHFTPSQTAFEQGSRGAKAVTETTHGMHSNNWQLKARCTAGFKRTESFP